MDICTTGGLRADDAPLWPGLHVKLPVGGGVPNVQSGSGLPTSIEPSPTRTLLSCQFFMMSGAQGPLYESYLKCDGL